MFGVIEWIVLEDGHRVKTLLPMRQLFKVLNAGLRDDPDGIVVLGQGLFDGQFEQVIQHVQSRGAW